MIRPFIHKITVCGILPGDSGIRLDMLVAVGSSGNVRPEEIVTILCNPEFLGIELEIDKIHRRELFVLEDRKFIQPV